MTASDLSTRGERVLRLLAIARGLEDDGYYNAAKVFRAAAESESVAATREHARLGGELEANMEAVLNELRAGDSDPELVEMLDRARAHVEEGHYSTLAEIPAPFVCRSCGRVLFQEAPAACPRCGARRYTFREFPPAYYLDPVEPDELLHALEANAAEVERITAGVTEEEAARGVWPLREIVRHLHGAEQLLTGRAMRMLQEDEPELTIAIPAEIGDEASGSTLDLVREYADARRAALRVLRDISPEQWQRGGTHPEWGRVTVLEQMSFVLRHEQSHLAELELRRNGE